MDTIDVLNLEWDASLSRDRQMATLVCNYLRFQGLKVVEGSIFNGYELIKKHHPNILFLTNITGAQINVDVVDYATQYGIKVVSLVSEGNFREKELEQFLWGWNIERKFKEILNMQWTERTRLMTLKHYPELQDKIKVSGAVGFDVYRILPRINKDYFLRKYRREKFTNVIGVGCWDFGIFYPEDTRYNYESSILSMQEINYFRKDGILFNQILEKVVLSNPTILFVLKEHPGCQIGKKGSAIENLDNYANTLIIKSEEVIVNCIAVSDFWITYESTTALEAWLMQKQTCLLNPQGGDFGRDEVAKGSPIYSSYEEIQANIDLFYSSGVLRDFKDKESVRERLIKDTIQWDDGFNHVRAGNEILRMVKNEKQDSHQYISFFERKHLKYFLLWRLCDFSFLRKNWKVYLTFKNRFKKEQLEEAQELFYKNQIKFYKDNKVNKDSLKEYTCL